MAIYEKYLGRSRDSFSSLKDAQENLKFSCPDDFNFAYDVIDELGRTKPDKTAMVWVSKNWEEKIISFSELSRESDRAAAFLYGLGIRRGDRVLLVLKRHYYFWYLLLGLHKIGAVEVHATSMLTAKDYVYRCNAAKVKAVIVSCDDGCTEHFDGGMGKYETVEHRFVIGGNAPDGWRDFNAEFESTPAEWKKPDYLADFSADETMMLCFSSGTTGYPKLISHDYRYPLGHIMTGVFWHRCVDGGLHLSVSDTGWMKAFWGKMYGQWFAESAIMVYDFDRFNGDDILKIVEKYKVTTFCVPPTMYRMILLKDVEKYDLSSIVHCCTAGEALGPEIYNEWLTRTGHKIYEGFGQSETPVIIASLAPYTEPVPGAAGLPVPGYDVQIVDEDCNPCPRGVNGEICVRVDSMATRPYGLLSSYNFNEEETANAYRDGFYHTGDIAYRDEKGMFRYVGRNDDIIKSSGYRIGPFEIESVMIEHPAVLEVAVTGVPDALRGFLVKATVVLREGYTPSDELVKELQNYVKANTAPYKYPRIIEFVDALPKTFSGKIRRTEIRQRDAEKYANK